MDDLFKEIHKITDPNKKEKVENSKKKELIKENNNSNLKNKSKKYNTLIIKLNPKNFDLELIKKAAEIIKDGGLVAFPTETVYGLGASAYNAHAIRKIFIAKGRPQDNPLIVHISSLDTLYKIVEEVPNYAKEFIKRFWPGPLTLVFKKNYKIPKEVTAGLDTVAIRMPANLIAHELIRLSYPIAAPSANLSGRPSPTNGEHVINDLNGKIDCIIDGGPCEIGLESTVVDVSHDKPVLLRPGGISFEKLKRINKEITIHPSIKNSNIELKNPPSPGMKYKHYAPKAQIIIINSDNKKKIIRTINSLIEQYKGLSKKIGLFTNLKTNFNNVLTIRYKNQKQEASLLFDALRKFDKENIDIIITHSTKTKGIGLAIMNRLSKAAGYNILNI